jgi:hypothetical protein
MRHRLPYYHVPSPYSLLIVFHIIIVRYKCATTFPTTMSLLLLSLLKFNHIISVRHKCATTFPTTMSLLLSLLKKIHILTNTTIVHVTSEYYHS